MNPQAPAHQAGDLVDAVPLADGGQHGDVHESLPFHAIPLGDEGVDVGHHGVGVIGHLNDGGDAAGRRRPGGTDESLLQRAEAVDMAVHDARKDEPAIGPLDVAGGHGQGVRVNAGDPPIADAHPSVANTGGKDQTSVDGEVPGSTCSVLGPNAWATRKGNP